MSTYNIKEDSSFRKTVNGELKWRGIGRSIKELWERGAKSVSQQLGINIVGDKNIAKMNQFT
jgi:hypothetical protein